MILMYVDDKGPGCDWSMISCGDGRKTALWRLRHPEEQTAVSRVCRIGHVIGMCLYTDGREIYEDWGNKGGG